METFYRVSLALWTRRHAYRHARLARAVKAENHNEIVRWHRLASTAARKIRERQTQLDGLVPKTWMPGAEIRSRGSAGAFHAGFAPRGVLHTTEGAGDATSTLDGNGDHPHFEVLQDGRIIQYIGLDQASKALVHSGGVDTNKAHAIQIEVCGFAAKPAWPAAQERGVKRLMRFIEANAGVQRATHVKFVSGGGARLGPAGWTALTGWCGHQHVPENDHIDPGPINIQDLLA